MPLTAWRPKLGFNLLQEGLKGCFGKTEVLAKHQGFVCAFQALGAESIVC